MEEVNKDYCVGGEGSLDDAPNPKRRSRVMAACACILGNETAERLAYCECCG
jgi:hypothetical protein